MRVRDLKKKSSNRIDTSYLQNLGIQAYGQDNLYPQTLKNIIAASSTASECSDRFADFIEGNGFREVAFSKYVVNRKGDTLDDVHMLLCKDMSELNGIAIHVNYNVFCEIVEMQHVPFENCRLTEEDENGYVAKIAVHPDWSGKKTRKGKALQVKKENIDYIDVFNPQKDVILAQIEVATEMSTDEGLSNVKYRNVRNNFFPGAMIFTKKGSNITFDEEGNEVKDTDDDDSFSNTLIQLQGDTNAGKIMEVTLENDEEKPEIVNMNSQNYDKEFTVTDASVVERIYSAYGQEPWYCIRIGKVGFSGDILEDAFEYYNSIVSKQQRLIERTFSRIFSYWYEVVNPSNDYSVEPLKYVRNAAVSNNNR